MSRRYVKFDPAAEDRHMREHRTRLEPTLARYARLLSHRYGSCRPNEGSISAGIRVAIIIAAEAEGVCFGDINPRFVLQGNQRLR